MNDSDLALYDVLLFWDHNYDESIEYKKRCSEIICNILGYPAELAVKIMYEAIDNTYGLLYTTKNKDKAVQLRDLFLSSSIECKVRPLHINMLKNQ